MILYAWDGYLITNETMTGSVNNGTLRSPSTATKVQMPDNINKGQVTYRIISDYLGSVRLAINTTDGSILLTI